MSPTPVQRSDVHNNNASKSEDASSVEGETVADASSPRLLHLTTHFSSPVQAHTHGRTLNLDMLLHCRVQNRHRNVDSSSINIRTKIRVKPLGFLC